MLYNELSDLCECQDQDELDDPERLYTYKEILEHKGPIKPDDEEYKGCSWNVKVQWDDGTRTWEPLSVIGKDDPAGVALYAKNNNLLHLPGWKRLNAYLNVPRS